MKEPNRIVYFATSNRGKFVEAAEVTSRFGIRLKQLPIEKQEIQSNDLAQIASFAARQASDSKKSAVLAEDAGLFVKALNGFPGPYSAYVFQTVGVRGVLRLLGGRRERQAYFKAVVAYCAPGRRPHCFTGLVSGFVNRKPVGAHGFGFDPIFVPQAGDRRTFAQMLAHEKNQLSHRAKAFERFSEWFVARRESRVRQVK